MLVFISNNFSMLSLSLSISFTYFTFTTVFPCLLPCFPRVWTTVAFHILRDSRWNFQHFLYVLITDASNVSSFLVFHELAVILWTVGKRAVPRVSRKLSRSCPVPLISLLPKLDSSNSARWSSPSKGSRISRIDTRDPKGYRALARYGSVRLLGWLLTWRKFSRRKTDDSCFALENVTLLTRDVKARRPMQKKKINKGEKTRRRVSLWSKTTSVHGACESRGEVPR